MNCLIAVIVISMSANANEPAAKQSTEFISHRGESFDAPENTLAAFRLAWERNVPAIELDVHLTKDGRVILCHDADTKRTTGKKLAIQDTEYATLRTLDAGSWKDPKWSHEKLPSLEEVLATIPDHGKCFIEIKVGPEAVPAVAKAIQASGKRPEQLIIISFKAETIAESKRQLPQLKAYFLSSFKKDKATGKWSPTVTELIEQAKALHADGLDLSHEGPLTEESVKQIKAAGLNFCVWTVDDVAVARRFIEWGADGITSNRAAWLREQCSSGPQPGAR